MNIENIARSRWLVWLGCLTDSQYYISVLYCVSSLVCCLFYAGAIIFVTIPALYSRFEEPIDKFAGSIHQKFSRQYKVVDEDNVRRLSRTISKDKDEWLLI